MLLVVAVVLAQVNFVVVRVVVSVAFVIVGKIVVIGPEEMPILVWGRHNRPKLNWDQPKTYKF